MSKPARQQKINNNDPLQHRLLSKTGQHWYLALAVEKMITFLITVSK